MAWFRIDDGFHEHRKVRLLGKDKTPAVGVWTLCGVWAAQTLSNGFVPAEVVQRHDPRERYAKRLVEVGLWHVSDVDGERGYLYHQWEEHQPSRDEVLKRRDTNKKRVEAWRKKKREQSDVDGNADSNALQDNMNGDGNALRTHAVTPPPSRPVPARPGPSRPSTPDGVDQGGSPEPAQPTTARDKTPPPNGHNGQRPAEQCPKHLGSSDDTPCRACRQARETAERWDDQRWQRERAAASEAAHERAELRRREIADCGQCDEDGYVGTALCRHDPHAAEAARRGRQAVEAVLAAARKPAPSTSDSAENMPADIPDVDHE